jgi:hypothetical protein
MVQEMLEAEPTYISIHNAQSCFLAASIESKHLRFPLGVGAGG